MTWARTMKGWCVPEAGEPEGVMRLEELAVPTPGPGQVLVRVRAAALNFADVLMCRGTYQVRPPLPFTPGIELCGEIVAAGAGVRSLTLGERVIGMSAMPHGGFAEYALLNEASALPAPAELDDAEAASFYGGYQTGWFGLHRRAKLAAGETLLVHAAAGGVGAAAVQLGKAAGARVIAVVGGPAKADVARALGADLVIDRCVDDFVEAVKQFTSGSGADVIYDPVGGETYQRSTKCLAFEGRILVVGFASGDIPSAKLNHALVKNYSIVGLHCGLYIDRDPAAVLKAHDALCQLVTDGSIHPVVSERLPLTEVAAGLQRVVAGHTVGRCAYVSD